MQRKKHREEVRDILYFWGGGEVSVGGSQAKPARPSNRNNVKMKPLG
jgi:hypothetical protein